jgi:hypothetical protein
MRKSYSRYLISTNMIRYPLIMYLISPVIPTLIFFLFIGAVQLVRFYSLTG